MLKICTNQVFKKILCTFLFLLTNSVHPHFEHNNASYLMMRKKKKYPARTSDCARKVKLTKWGGNKEYIQTKGCLWGVKNFARLFNFLSLKLRQEVLLCVLCNGTSLKKMYFLTVTLPYMFTPNTEIICYCKSLRLTNKHASTITYTHIL